MPAMTKHERTELKKVISAFYKRAGRSWGDRPVNYCVAETFAIMLAEAIKASNALAWLPLNVGKPNIRWLLSLIIKGLTAESLNRLHPLAVIKVIDNWHTIISMNSTMCAK